MTARYTCFQRRSRRATRPGGSTCTCGDRRWTMCSRTRSSFALALLRVFSAPGAPDLTQRSTAPKTAPVCGRNRTEKPEGVQINQIHVACSQPRMHFLVKVFFQLRAPWCLVRALHVLAEGLSCEDHGHVGVRSVLVLVAGRATWSKQLICGLADVAMILLCLSVVLVLARVSARAAIVLFLVRWPHRVALRRSSS